MWWAMTKNVVYQFKFELKWILINSIKKKWCRQTQKHFVSCDNLKPSKFDHQT